MEQVLQFFANYEIWIYIILGILALWQIRKFSIAWGDLRGAFFGMEREAAQSRVNSAATLIVLFILMAVAEFTIVTFVTPTVPGANPLPTSTLDLLATPTITLAPPTQNPNETPGATPTPGEIAAAQGCVPGQVNFTDPLNGGKVSGSTTIQGTAFIPNFGFYSLQIALPGDPVWLPIQVGQQAVKNDTLGVWDTSTLSPGAYMLRLEVTDNVGNVMPACDIQVTVEAVP